MSFLSRSFFTKGTRIFMDYAYWKPFQIIDFFRDRLTELSFSCFIAYSGENYEAVKKFNEWHKNAIYATMFLSNPSILFSTFGDYFFYDPVISNFVKGNKYLYGVLEAIMQLKKEGKELTEMQSILTYLSSMPPFSFIANILADILKRPINFYTEWVENIYNFIVKANYDFVSACSTILSEFNKTLGKTVVYALKPQVVVLICPWIYYLFPTIISHIRINYAYSMVEPKKERPTLKGSIFKYLLAELYFDNKYIESKPTLSDGSIVFTMPKEEFNKLYPREITINVMGLKTTYFLPWRVKNWASTETLPEQIIILDENDFETAKSYMNDCSLILINDTIPNVEPSEINSLTEKYALTFYMLKDTASYYPINLPAWYGIFYKKLNPHCPHVDANVLIDENMIKHFNSQSIPALIDYFTYNQDKLDDCIPYVKNTYDYQATWSYRFLNKSIIVEVPNDGLWKDVETLKKWIMWIGHKNVICISRRYTDIPGWHEYPSLTATLRALSSRYNIPIIE
ncbi:MAG: hypothetical protein QXW80_05900 [Candidatus Micrarchaeia archaeon]